MAIADSEASWLSPHNYVMVIRRDVLAEALWEYGEDELAQRVLSFSEEELDEASKLATFHELNDPEPSGRIWSRAVIELVEGEARDTTRRRRRTRPEDQRYYAEHARQLLSGEPLDDTPAERGDFPTRPRG